MFYKKKAHRINGEPHSLPLNIDIKLRVPASAWMPIALAKNSLSFIV